MSEISVGSPANNVDKVKPQHPYLSENDDVYVIVPAYNEEGVIFDVVEGLCKLFRYVVVIDDGSIDGTAECVRNTFATLLKHSVNLGQGAALQTGISYALQQGADYVVTFDADGQHLAKDAISMLQELRKGGCDVVVGSRFLGSAVNMPTSRRWLLKLAVLFSNFTTGTRLTDTHNGLRVLNRKAAQALNFTQNGMAHASEILEQFSRARLTLKEMPVTIQYTEYSLNKGQSAGNAINILIDLVVGRLLK
jgi:glycosyltransferase involved in cell wall biosynthesis